MNYKSMLDTWNIYAKRETMLRVMSLDWIFVEQKCIEHFANGDETGAVEGKDSSLVHQGGSDFGFDAKPFEVKSFHVGLKEGRRSHLWQ